MRLSYFLIFILLCHSAVATDKFEQDYRYERMWPAPKQPWYFDQPESIAVDKDGFVYVSSAQSLHVRKFTEDGEFVRRWQFGEDQPKRVAVDKDNNLYVLYRKPRGSFHKQGFVRVFDDKGQVLHLWGESVADEPTITGDETQSVSDSTLTVDHEGYVYLVDSRYNYLQKFTQDGKKLSSWHLERYARDSKDMSVAVGLDGSIYVMYPNPDAPEQIPSPDKYTLVKYDQAGNKLHKWGKYGNGKGQFIQPGAIALDRYGDLYVTDEHQQTIQKFSSDGRFIEEIGGLSEPNSTAIELILEQSPISLIYNSSPDLWEIMVLEMGVLNRIFGTRGSQGSPWGFDTEDNTTEMFAAMLDGLVDGSSNFRPYGIAIHPRNQYMYLTHASDLVGRVRSYSPQGDMFEWNSSNGMYAHYGEELIFKPTDIERYVDSTGQVLLYLTDIASHRILKFREDGTYLGSLGEMGVAKGQLILPIDIAIDRQGMLYVAEFGNLRVQKFDISQGGFEFIAEVGSAEENETFTGYSDIETFYNIEERSFAIPMYLETDLEDNLYVVDIARNNVQKFSPEGERLDSFGGTGSEPDELTRITGIAIDQANHVYVIDYTDETIQKYDEDGEYLHTYRSEYIQSPFSMTIDENNHLYLYDYETFFSKFSIGTESLELVTRWGEKGTYPNEVSETTTITVSPDGTKVYVAELENSRVQIFQKDFITAGKAIIIAGTDEIEGGEDPLWEDYTQVNAELAYYTLRHRGFTKEQIRYIRPDIKDTNDAQSNPRNIQEASIEAVQKAITEWALTDWPSDARNLTIYIVDHGGPGEFYLTQGVQVSDEQLNEWVTAWQNETQGLVTIIYDACYAGSIIDELWDRNTGIRNKKPEYYPNRILISSSHPDKKISGLPFSNRLWTDIFYGSSLEKAYSNAVEHVERLGDPGYAPRLKDTSNQLSDLYIGAVNVRFEDNPSEIEYDIIKVGKAFRLDASVKDEDGILKVWANITLPKKPEDESVCINSTENNQPCIVKCVLRPSQWPGTKHNYTTDTGNTSCELLTEIGNYNIALYVEDKKNYVSSPMVKLHEHTRGLRRKAAIIVTGSSKQFNYSNIAPDTQQIYSILINQGYLRHDIRYLINAPVDIEQFTFAANLQTVHDIFSEDDGWLQENTRDFLIYIMGYGDQDSIILNEQESLSFAQLAEYLQTIQDNYVQHDKLVVVYDGYNSSYLLPTVANIPKKKGVSRIVIASHSQDDYQQRLLNGELLEVLPDYSAFSEFFWQSIDDGINIRYAFEQKHIKNPNRLLDDNYDGIYAKDYDGGIAEMHHIGRGTPLASSDNDKPTILSLLLPPTTENHRRYVVISPLGTTERWYAIQDTNRFVPYQDLASLPPWRGISPFAINDQLDFNTTILPKADQYLVYSLTVPNDKSLTEQLQITPPEELILRWKKPYN